MHEAGLAQAILDTVLRAAQGNRAQAVVRVEIEVGEVCLVNTEQLVFFLRELAQGTIAGEMAVVVTEVMTRIRCRDCSYEGGIEYEEVEPGWHYRTPLFSCPCCGSNATEIVRGKEMTVRSIDVR